MHQNCHAVLGKINFSIFYFFKKIKNGKIFFALFIFLKKYKMQKLFVSCFCALKNGNCENMFGLHFYFRKITFCNCFLVLLRSENGSCEKKIHVSSCFQNNKNSKNMVAFFGVLKLEAVKKMCILISLS